MKKNMYTFCKPIIIMVLSLLSNILTQAQQGVGINTNSPDPSALLEISTTQGGLGLPVLTDAQRLNILTPPNGLVIYNSTTKKLNAFLQGFWMESDDVAITNTQATGTGVTGYVSIGDNTPHPSAALDLESGGNKGLALPYSGRLVTAPVTGLFAVDPAACQLVVHDGTAWTNLVLNSLGSTTGATTTPGLMSMATVSEVIPRDNTVLDLQSTSQGLLLPDLTNTQRDAIPSPKEGLLIYSTDDECLEYWNGTEWRCIIQTSNPVIYTACNYIFSDVCGSPTNASSKGIFSDDPNQPNDVNNTNDFVFSGATISSGNWVGDGTNAGDRRRNDWIGCPGPCDGNIPAMARSLDFDPDPEFDMGDQSEDLMIIGGPGAAAYTFIAPNGTAYGPQASNTLTIPAEEVLAEMSGTWTMLASDAPGCDLVFIKYADYLIPLQLDCGGIISDELATPVEINLNAYQGLDNNPLVFSGDGEYADTRACTNKWIGARGPCLDEPFVNLPGDVAFIYSPSPFAMEQMELTLSFSNFTNPGYIFTWTAPNGQVFTTTTNTKVIPADSVVAAMSGEWTLVISDEYHCSDSPTYTTDILVIVNSSECQPGIYSADANNTDVIPDQWRECPDVQQEEGPCAYVLPGFAQTDFIFTGPDIEQSADLMVNAPALANATYVFSDILGNAILSGLNDDFTIPANSITLAGSPYSVYVQDANGCVVGGALYYVNELTDKCVPGIYSEDANNMDVIRDQWRSCPKTDQNEGPCSYILAGLTPADFNITMPDIEQNGDLMIDAPSLVGATYKLTTSTGGVLRMTSADDMTIPMDSVLLAWSPFNIAVTDANGCEVGGTNIFINEVTAKCEGLYSETTNNTVALRDSWRQCPKAGSPKGQCVNTTFGYTAADIMITGPAEEQEGNVVATGPVNAALTYTLSSGEGGYLINSASNVITVLADQVFATHETWTMIITDNMGCIVTNKTQLFDFEFKAASNTGPYSGTSNANASGIFSGDANNVARKDQWRDGLGLPNARQ